MPDIGLPEIAIIAVIVFFLFGAQRLPKLGKSLGQGISGFKKGLNGGYDDEEDEVEPTAVVEAEAVTPAAEQAPVAGGQPADAAVGAEAPAAHTEALKPV
jgi:sec-independent protein translocase protein TatA